MTNQARKTTQPATCHPEGAAATEGSLRHEGTSDRFSAALNFANGLNDSRLWKIRISYQKRWTKYRKTRQSVRIRMQKPWLHATGPKTAKGKAIAAKNAMAGDSFDRAFFIPALEANARFLRAVNLAITLERNGTPMPDNLQTHLKTMAQDSTNHLLAVLLAAPTDWDLKE